MHICICHYHDNNVTLIMIVVDIIRRTLVHDRRAFVLRHGLGRVDLSLLHVCSILVYIHTHTHTIY